MTSRRRARGAVVGASAVFAKVHPDAALALDVVAKRVGVSKAEFVEILLLHMGSTLDESGAPSWWTKPLPSDEELSHAC